MIATTIALCRPRSHQVQADARVGDVEGRVGGKDEYAKLFANKAQSYSERFRAIQVSR